MYWFVTAAKKRLSKEGTGLCSQGYMGEREPCRQSGSTTLTRAVNSPWFLLRLGKVIKFHLPSEMPSFISIMKTRFVFIQSFVWLIGWPMTFNSWQNPVA